MNTIGLVKGITGLVVASGVSTIVVSAAKSSIPVTAKLTKKISVGIGAAVLSGMVADQAVKYTDERIDEAVAVANTVTEVVENISNAQR